MGDRSEDDTRNPTPITDLIIEEGFCAEKVMPFPEEYASTRLQECRN